jgi:hypothetical protein
VVVILHTILVANDFAIQLVDQVVYSGVKIGMRAFGKHVGAFDVDIALGALPSFFFFLLFNGEENFDIDHLVKMSGYSIKLGRDVTSKRWGNFEMMTADRQVHKWPPNERVEKGKCRFHYALEGA